MTAFVTILGNTIGRLTQLVSKHASNWLTGLPTHSPTYNPLIPSLTYSPTHLHTHSLVQPRPVTHPLITHPSSQPVTYSSIESVSHSSIHLLIHSVSHSLIRSLSLSLTHLFPTPLSGKCGQNKDGLSTDCPGTQTLTSGLLSLQWAVESALIKVTTDTKAMLWLRSFYHILNRENIV